MTSNTFFNISINVTCRDADCGEVNVSFDPFIADILNTLMPSVSAQEEYMELLIKTSDNWVSDYNESRAGNAKQGYIIDARPQGWSWGRMERDPKRFLIVTIPTSLWNESWLEPLYDDNGMIIQQRKYRLPLEEILNVAELTALKSIQFNSEVAYELRRNF